MKHVKFSNSHAGGTPNFYRPVQPPHHRYLSQHLHHLKKLGPNERPVYQDHFRLRDRLDQKRRFRPTRVSEKERLIFSSAITCMFAPFYRNERANRENDDKRSEKIER